MNLSDTVHHLSHSLAIIICCCEFNYVLFGNPVKKREQKDGKSSHHEQIEFTESKKSGNHLTIFVTKAWRDVITPLVCFSCCA